MRDRDLRHWKSLIRERAKREGRELSRRRGRRARQSSGRRAWHGAARRPHRTRGTAGGARRARHRLVSRALQAAAGTPLSRRHRSRRPRRAAAAPGNTGRHRGRRVVAGAWNRRQHRDVLAGEQPVASRAASQRATAAGDSGGFESPEHVDLDLSDLGGTAPAATPVRRRFRLGHTAPESGVRWRR